MTEEEAIDILEELSTFDYVKLEDGDTAIETILNLVKKQQEEIEKKDTLINTMQAEFERLEDLEDNTDMLKLELKKKDKIIDEIIKDIHMLNSENGCYLGIHGFIDNCIGMSHCKKCLKQYFENKVGGIER